jgi:hypothetical protein
MSRNKRRTLIDGPFAETTELIGRYAILQAKSKEEAIGLADRVLEVHIKAGVPEFEMEIRPLFDPADFGPEKSVAAASAGGDVRLPT